MSNATVAKDCSNSMSGYSGSSLTELFVFIYNSASIPVDVSGPFPSKISTIGLREREKMTKTNAIVIYNWNMGNMLDQQDFL